MRTSRALWMVIVIALASRGGSSSRSAPTTTTTTFGQSTTSGPPAPITVPAAPSTDPGSNELSLRYGTVRERNVSPGADGRDVTRAVEGANQFALDTYRLIAAEHTGENLVLGPYTMMTALGMTYASAAGGTAAEMAAVLHADLPADRWHEAINAYDLTLESRTAGTPVGWDAASKVWVEAGLPLEPAFLDILTGRYGSPVAEANFAGQPDVERTTINQWVDEQTRQRIPELFPPATIDVDTRLVLVNAVALDAPWEFPFDPARTRDGPFRGADGSTAMVPTMHYDDFLPTARGDGWQAVELPYAGGALSMVVIVAADLGAFEVGFDAARLAEVIGALRDGGLHLSMPKFTARTHLALNDTLSALGMPSAFSGDADFSGITGTKGLSIATVEHEAFIEIDEQGTRAAAATGVAIAVSHGPTVTIDRPFLYVVRDRGAGTVLFVGRIADPTITA